MAQLIVTDEQARLISESDTTIPICDGRGRVIGHAVGLAVQTRSAVLTSRQIAEAEKRLESDGPWFTTSQVMDHLRRLESE